MNRTKKSEPIVNGQRLSIYVSSELLRALRMESRRRTDTTGHFVSMNAVIRDALSRAVIAKPEPASK